MTSDADPIPTVVAVVVRGHVGLPADDACSLLSDMLSRISVRCGRIGVIGHNKANFRCGGDLLSISCTTEDGNVRSKVRFGKDVGDVDGVVDVIVYSAGYDELRRIVEEEATASGLHAEFAERSGCHDPDCHDPHCCGHHHER